MWSELTIWRNSSSSGSVRVRANAWASSSPSPSSPRILVPLCGSHVSQNLGGKRKLNRPHPAVRVVGHTSKEGGLVLKISNAKTLQTRYASPTDCSGATCTSLVCLPHELRLVTSGYVKLADIRNNDECSCKYAFVSSLGAFHEFPAEDNVQ